MRSESKRVRIMFLKDVDIRHKNVASCTKCLNHLNKVQYANSQAIGDCILCGTAFSNIWKWPTDDVARKNRKNRFRKIRDSRKKKA